MAREVGDADFDAEVLRAARPVLVDFWAPWCGPCRMVAPVVEAVAQEFAGSLDVVKVNVDESPRTAMDYGVMSIPTLGFFRDGRLAQRVVGYLPQDALRRKVQAFLSEEVAAR